MNARDDAIEAAERAFQRYWGSTSPSDGEVAATLVDAVEPIIRADERERIREQVEELPTHEFTVSTPLKGGGWVQYAAAGVRRSDVLDLLGGDTE